VTGEYRVYFGDLHSHNSLGAAQGSLERTFDIAREHLDFSAFMGHSQWHDIPHMPQNKEQKWLDGFQVHTRRWPQVQALNRELYRPGQFVTFNGYEWHSSDCGDYNIIFPGEDSELFIVNSVEELAARGKPYGAILCPHHAAYGKFWRGVVWERLPQWACPICETFSEHGNCFDDRGLEPMIRHSLGGRATKGTILWALQHGFRFGLVGGTDDHFACPGAWGEGLACVWATELTREGIWEALLARRTYAVTGDRIILDFTLNGAPMGAQLAFDTRRELHVSVEAMDEISMVEVLKNGRVVHTRRVPTVLPQDPYAGGRARLRIRWGWGPWAALDMPRTCDWAGRIELRDGRLIKATPIIQSGPLDDERRDTFRNVTDSGLDFTSFTSRYQAYNEDPTKGVILEIEGRPQTQVSLALSRPHRLRYEHTLADLMESSASHFVGRFTEESVLFHRLVVPESYTCEFTWTDAAADDSDGGPTGDFYIIRVVQSNGQMAWSSPVWVKGLAN